MKPAKKQAAKLSTIAVVSNPDALASTDSADCTDSAKALPSPPPASVEAQAKQDKQDKPSEAIEFDIERLDVVYRLPVVSVDAETHPAPMAPGCITVFKNQDGKNMELVLAWARDLQHKTDGLTMIDPATGMALAAQPFAKDAA